MRDTTSKMARNRFSSKVCRGRTYRPLFETLESRLALATVFGLTDASALIQFDSLTPGTVTTTAVTGVNASESLVGIDFRPQNGYLYGLGVNATANTATLYNISFRTGVATAVGATGSIVLTNDGSDAIDLPDPAAVGYGFDFNPAADRVRVVAGSLNFRLNPNTGGAVDGDNGTGAAVTGINPDGAISGGTTTVDATAYTNNEPNTAVTTQYTLDASTDSLFIQNPPNNGTQILVAAVMQGGSALDFTSVNGFDIPAFVNAAAPSGTPVAVGSAFAALNVGGTTGLYSIDLTNGQATSIGDIGPGTTALKGLAVQNDLGGFPAIAIDLTGTNLFRFNTATPGTATIQAVGVASLAAGEQLVGIDFRPQTGQLYGLAVNGTANTGTLYLIDPQSGALTAVGTQGQIAFVATDGTTPVDLPVAGTGHGFDFNPTVDRIRVTTNSGLNFRVNPNNGAPVDTDANAANGINPDGNINGSGVTGISANAYTNSFGQPLTMPAGPTTLYTFQSFNGNLYIQNPPNAGTQTAPVPVTLAGAPLTGNELNGFDIPAAVSVATANAPANGFGFVVLPRTEGMVTSTKLFRINLRSGVATDLGAAGSSNLAGLALGDNPVATADLAVTKSDTPDPVTQGNNITYTLTVTNNGPNDAPDVVVTDVIPANTTFDNFTNISQGQAIFQSGLVTATFGTVEVGMPATLSFTVTVNAGTPMGTVITNSATASSAAIDPVFTNDTGTSTTDVQAANTSTNLTTSDDTTVFGESVTFTATVTSNSTPTGSVTFVDTGGDGDPSNDVVLGTDTLNGSGQASVTVNNVGVGVTVIRATFNANAAFNGSSDTVMQTVAQGTTTTTLMTSQSASVFGQSVTFTATVSPNAPSTLTPAGSVTFVDTSNGSNLGTVDLDGSGMASVIVNNLSVGTHQIRADFNGTVNYASSSGLVTQAVTQGTTTTDLTSSLNPSQFGQTVTFTATVDPVAPSTLQPTGSVTFVDTLGDANPANDVVLGTDTVDSTTGEASVDVTSLSIGNHTIEARFADPSGGYAASSDNIVQVVNPVPVIPPQSPGTAVLLADPFNPGDTVLVVTGTAKNDSIVVKPVNGQIRVYLNGKVIGTFSPDGFDRIIVRAGAGNDSVVIAPNIGKPSELNGEAGNDSMVGTNGPDVLIGGPGKDVLVGLGGDDEITGEDGNDVIDGGAGNDTLAGGLGNDVIVGGSGNDTITGDEGNDVIKGGSGNDILSGDAGKDVIAGESGDDSATGGAGNDVITGGAGNDELSGGENNDVVAGEAGNDQVFGDDGNDTVKGGAGNDLVFGGLGNDKAYGEAGNDFVLGEDGNDFVYGGAGRDILVGGIGADTLYGEAGDDILVGGTTSADNDEATAAAIFAAWTGPGTYTERMDAVLDTNVTVDEDNAVDTLFGQGNQDWFLIGTGDKVKDKAKNEIVT